MPLIGFNTSISWSQFQQLDQRPDGENEDAQIHPEMENRNAVLGRSGRGVAIREVDVTITLISSDCWVVRSQMTDYLLRHEQGHYDILSLAARELYNRLIGMSARSTDALQTAVTRLVEDIGRRVNTVDRRYDDATDHSRNTSNQQRWNAMIAAALRNPRGRIGQLQ